MKLGTFLVIATVIYGIFGLAAVLVPGQIYAGQGITLNNTGQLMAQTQGAAILGLAVIFWQSRGAANSPALRAVLLGNVVYIVIEIIVLVLGLTSGVLSAVAAPGIVVDVLLGVGFAYYYRQLSRSSAA